jgi:hypothetical protein
MSRDRNGPSSRLTLIHSLLKNDRPRCLEAFGEDLRNARPAGPFKSELSKFLGINIYKHNHELTIGILKLGKADGAAVTYVAPERHEPALKELFCCPGSSCIAECCETVFCTTLA